MDEGRSLGLQLVFLVAPGRSRDWWSGAHVSALVEATC